jgi:hypothetical protein
VAKAIDTVVVEDLYKLTVLNFPSYLVKTISHLDCRTFQTSFQSATSARRVMRAGVAQDGLISPVLFSLYVNDTPAPSRHVEFAQYADDTAFTATSRVPSLLVGYLEAYLRRLELWLRNWRIVTNVSKSTAVPFAKAARRVRQPRPTQFLGEPIQWVEAPRYLGATLDTPLTWSAHVNQARRKQLKDGVLGPLLNRKSSLSVRNRVLLYKQLIRPMMDYACPICRSAASSHV